MTALANWEKKRPAVASIAAAAVAAIEIKKRKVDKSAASAPGTTPPLKSKKPKLKTHPEAHGKPIKVILDERREEKDEVPIEVILDERREEDEDMALIVKHGPRSLRAHTVNILDQWIIAHFEHIHPSKYIKLCLAKKIGYNIKQVLENCFTRYRKRI